MIPLILAAATVFMSDRPQLSATTYATASRPSGSTVTAEYPAATKRRQHLKQTEEPK